MGVGLNKNTSKNIVKKVIAYFRRTQILDTQTIFENIYENKVWGESNSSKFYSGSGSNEAYSASYIKLVSNFIEFNQIKTVIDLGCGDFRIGSKICESGVRYTGVDIVPALIANHNLKYATDKVKFLHRNIVQDKLPNAELCLIRQVLQHLSNKQIKKIVKKLKKYKFCIITEHWPLHDNAVPNLDKKTNGDIRLDMNSGVFLDRHPYKLKVQKLLEVFPVEHPNSRIVTLLIVNAEKN